MILIISCILLVFNFCCVNAECTVPSETTANGTYYKSSGTLCAGHLIFEENFDHLDLNRWQHEVTLAGGGNGEFQYYLNDRKNSYVQNGNLHIRPTFLADDYGEGFLYSGTLNIPSNICTNSANWGCKRTGTRTHILNPIKSARIRTVNSFSFRYGTMEIRAKMPAGDWLWPAIWLLPHDWAYGGWPASGEIDLVESRGNKDYHGAINIGTQQVSSTLHWGPDYFHNQFYRTHWERNNNAGYDTGFHVYKVEWTSWGFKFFVDGAQIGSVSPPNGGFWQLGDLQKSRLPNPWRKGTKMAPFDQKFYILINLAVGGTNDYFPDSVWNRGGKPWNNKSPTAMTDFWKGRGQWEHTWNRRTDQSHFIVDYVRVYAA